MAALAGNEPRRCLLLLKNVRFLYGRYQRFFQPLPASGQKLAYTLSSLNDGINRLSKYNTGNGPLLAFSQLTLGLSDTLIALQRGLRSSARDYGSDTLDVLDWPFELDSESMEQLHTRLHPMSVGLDIINDAIETAIIESSGTRSSETIEEIYKRIDEAQNGSARLSTLVHDFLHGITSQIKLETPDGRDLHVFTFANVSHCEVGQKIAARLRLKTEEAVKTKHEDEGRSAWIVRHGIYWLSKSSEDLREWRSENGSALSYYIMSASDAARHMIAKAFLNAIKAAWLLDDLGDLAAYGESSLEIRDVVACAKKKVLSLLQSFYGDIFTVPDYDLINERGDFVMCTYDERELAASKPSDMDSILSSTGSEPEVMHKQAADSIVSLGLGEGSLVSLIDPGPHSMPPEYSANPVNVYEKQFVPLEC